MQHVLAGEHIVSSDRIPSLTRSLRVIGSGASRTAYDLGNGTVLKVTGSWNQNRGEVALWEKVKDSEYAEHFAEVIAYDEEDFYWIIQRKADRVATEWELSEFVSTIGYELDSVYGILTDLHARNLGVIEDEDGEVQSFVIIDYALTYGGYANSPSCDCGDIDCRQCGCGLYPHGDCNCPTFAGHRRVTCHVSDCFDTANVPIWLPTWFANGFSREQGACALDHAPIGHALGRELRRIAGQQELAL